MSVFSGVVSLDFRGLRMVDLDVFRIWRGCVVSLNVVKCEPAYPRLKQL